jgi:hypothetical protein
MDATVELRELLAATLVNEDSVVQEATERLMEVEQDASFLVPILAIVRSESQRSIQQPAVATCGRMMRQAWFKSLLKGVGCAQLQEKLIEILMQFRHSFSICRNLAHSIAPMIAVDFHWLLDFLARNVNNAFACPILIEICHSADLATLTELSELCLNVVSGTMERTEPEAMQQSADLFSRAAHFWPKDYVSPAAELFGRFIERFLAAPRGGLGVAIANSFNPRFRVCDPRQLFEALVELFDSCKESVVLHVIRKLIRVYGVELRPLFPGFVTFLLAVSVGLFVEDCPEDDFEYIYVLSGIHSCAKRSPSSSFLEMLFPLLGTDTVPEFAASLAALCWVIQDCSPSLSTVAAPLKQLLKAALGHEYHSVKELACRCVRGIIENVPSFFADCCDGFFEVE